MSFHVTVPWLPRPKISNTSAVLFLVSLLALAGCSDEGVDPSNGYTAYLSMGAVAPVQAEPQLSQIDAWKIQVIRPGEGVIAEETGAIGAEQETVAASIAVTLQATCEVLTVVIELSANGEVWFRSEASDQVCAGVSNGIQTQNLLWVGPRIAVSPSGLSFSLQEGDDPATQTVTVTNQGGGALVWSASASQDWLDVSPSSGSLGAGQSTTVSATVSGAGLTGGQYQTSITFTAPNALDSPRTVNVDLTFVELPRISLSTASMAFATDEAIAPPSQTLTISNAGGGTLNWAITDDATWLAAAPASGSLGPGASQQVTVSVAPGTLPGGTYQGILTVNAPLSANAPRAVSVGLTVRPRPRIGLDPGILVFSATEGENPETRTMTVTNVGGQTLNWVAASGDPSWLGVTPSSGSLSAGQSRTLTVAVNASGLEAGFYASTLTFTDPWALNSPQVLPVQLTLNARPRIGLSTSALSFTMSAGENPLPQNVTVSNAGGGTLEWQAIDNAPWISLVPSSGSLGTVGGVGLAQTMTVNINATDLTAGTYQGIITVSDPDADNTPRTIAVQLVVLPRVAPVLSNLVVTLTTLNDPTCPNPEGNGSRFKAAFNYSDTNGDLPILDGAFAGTPVTVLAGFPDFTPTQSSTTADVSGSSFGGQASFDLCIYFNFHNGANLWVSLTDAWGLQSNLLFQSIPRPPGANAPPQSAAGSAGGTPGPSSGSVRVLGGGG